jgi:16S rRNA pseudouridine516 synthase
MRLDKLVSQAMDISRSQARGLVLTGCVAVDGQVDRAMDAQVNESASLSVDGKPISTQTELHLMLNKPAGLLTAARDSRAQTIMDILPPQLARLKCMPVGRLDKDTEGLLLLTSDGELAHRLLSPKREVEKVYEARVEGRLAQEDVQAFEHGIVLSDFTALPCTLTILSANDEETLAQVRLHEGKNRQVRRMFGSRGHEVLTLKRLQFGPITLDENLPVGEHRALSAQELRALREAVGLG